MIVQQIRKQGDRYVVEIPDEEMERQHLAEGQYVSLAVHPVEIRPSLSPEQRAAFEKSWGRDEAGYRALVEHDR